MAAQSLPSEVLKNGILKSCLNGVKRVLAAELGLKGLVISLDERVKNTQEKAQKKDTFPLNWLEFSDFGANKERMGNKHMMATIGFSGGMTGAQRNTMRRFFVFPVDVGLALKYQDNNPDRIIAIAESMLLLAQVNRLNFDLLFGGGAKVQGADERMIQPFVLGVSIEIPQSLTIPVGDTSDTTKPGAAEMELPLIIHAYAGFARNVESVYLANPIIGTALDNDDPETFTPGYAPVIGEEPPPEVDEDEDGP